MDNDFKMPSYPEIERITREAERMRAEVMRNGFVSLWRGITGIPGRIAGTVRRQAPV